MSTSEPETHTFQAEVRQLLDIVVHSLYTDREIFIRELVSNAADALARLRHHELMGETIYDEGLAREINISTDDTAGTLTIQDFGVGMTRAELVENIGTIARSGTKAFAAALCEAKESGANPLQLIGQFGVGFYSAFMVADAVKLYTHSWRADGESLLWTSTGAGAYTIEPTPDTQRRGVRIVIKLKDAHKEFAKKSVVEGILRRYSSFVPFPINLNGERVNRVEALWLRNRNEIKPEEYSEFYKYQANAFDEPRHTLHFNADAPLEIHALLFTPRDNIERFGFGRMDPGVALYCRKVMIDPHPEGLLPEWMRFVRGVVDSADLPLNISRETMQDSALVQKLSRVLSGRFIKHLADEAQKHPEAYDDFHRHFGIFLKEGVTIDSANRDKLARLLRFESSLTDKGRTTGLEDYVARMPDDQREVYYLVAPNREAAESGPYLEAFRARGREVLFLYEPIDEFVMHHLGTFAEKPLTAADSAEVKLDDVSADATGEALAEPDAKDLCAWLQETLGDRVKEVAPSQRLVDSPAVALNADKFTSPSMRRILKAMQQDVPDMPGVRLEINPRHPLLHKLHAMRGAQPELAALIAGQILDNCLIAAGYLDDPRPMVQRLYQILEKLG
jgi:molecular chaperone HtpG